MVSNIKGTSSLTYGKTYYSANSILASLSKPHSNVENGMVVHVRRTTTKNRIATY